MRKWDEKAKEVGLELPPLSKYIEMTKRHLKKE
jgi:predicted HD phosphohydrolase